MIRAIQPDDTVAAARPAKRVRKRPSGTPAIGIACGLKLLGVFIHDGAREFSSPDAAEIDFISNVCASALTHRSAADIGNWAAVVPLALRVQSCCALQEPIELPDDLHAAHYVRTVDAKLRQCTSKLHGAVLPDGRTVFDHLGYVDVGKIYFHHASPGMLLDRLRRGDPFNLPVPLQHVQALSIPAACPVDAHLHCAVDSIRHGRSGHESDDSSSSGPDDDENAAAVGAPKPCIERYSFVEMFRWIRLWQHVKPGTDMRSMLLAACDVLLEEPVRSEVKHKVTAGSIRWPSSTTLRKAVRKIDAVCRLGSFCSSQQRTDLEACTAFDRPKSLRFGDRTPLGVAWPTSGRRRAYRRLSLASSEWPLFTRERLFV